MWSSTVTITKEVKGDTDMENYIISTCTIDATFDEDITLDSACSDFGKMLFQEGFINVNTLYDKETGKLYRKLTISANKKEDN